MLDSDRDVGLIGRRTECQILDRFVRALADQHSGTLVLRGEAGVGKTALLDYIAQNAAGCRVIRTVGVEAEVELPYAGLHQACASMLGALDGLPAPQRDALGTAFGLIDGDPPNRFLVGLGTLSLFSAGTEQQPLLCLIDDAQWLDELSASVLAFVARRLFAESVGLVFAMREPNDRREFDGLPEHAVAGLSVTDARSLLDTASMVRVDERVRDRIVAETRGNPLAILELPRQLSAAELAGGFTLPATRPLAGQIEQSFLRRIRELPAETQRLLLVASADPLGDGLLVRRAAALLGISADAARPAEVADLVEFGARVKFRHPLVRSATYRAGSLTERRAAHGALAEATDRTTDPDREVWHRARAAAGPDEGVAADLEQSAARAQNRGGVAAAAAFLERAAELTADPAVRAARSLAAARAKFEAAALDESDALLGVAELGPLSQLEQAEVVRLRAQIAFARRRGDDAPALLLDAAKRLERLDASLCREAYLEALGAAIFAGRLGLQPDERTVAARALSTPASPGGPIVTDLLLDAVSTRYTDGYAAAAPALRRTLAAFRDAARSGGDGILRWLWLACPVAPEPVAPELWDYETWHTLSSRAVAFARDAGALGVLPIALAYRAGVHVQAGEFSEAVQLLDEADTISASTGSPPLRYTSLALVAWQGDAARASDLLASATEDAQTRGEGRALGLIGYATAVLHNGLGNYDAALSGARFACEHDDLGFFGWSLGEMIEAAARTDALESAAEALEQLDERATAADTPWSLGVLARSKALVSAGSRADALYRESIEHLRRSSVAVHLARSHLVYGEWLRREKRRLDARAQLHIADEMFTAMGAQGFAQRARRELSATGEKLRSRGAGGRGQLTPQEAQIARMAAAGRSNPEIGTELFISARTVEYHLSKVFAKVGVSARRELRKALAKLDT